MARPRCRPASARTAVLTAASPAQAASTGSARTKNSTVIFTARAGQAKNDLGAKNDRFVNKTDIWSTGHGGTGNDVIIGGTVLDVIDGGDNATSTGDLRKISAVDIATTCERVENL